MGVILTDFPLNPPANLRLSARRDFFRDSARGPPCFVFTFFSREGSQPASACAAHEDHNYGIPKQESVRPERERERERTTCKRGLPLCQVKRWSRPGRLPGRVWGQPWGTAIKKSILAKKDKKIAPCVFATNNAKNVQSWTKSGLRMTIYTHRYTHAHLPVHRYICMGCCMCLDLRHKQCRDMSVLAFACLHVLRS